MIDDTDAYEQAVERDEQLAEDFATPIAAYCDGDDWDVVTVPARQTNPVRPVGEQPIAKVTLDYAVIGRMLAPHLPVIEEALAVLASEAHRELRDKADAAHDCVLVAQRKRPGGA